MPAQSPLAPSEPSGTASETTPLLSSSAASPLSPEVPQLTDDAAADALDASSISLSESQIPDLPFSILVPALGSLWLVLFLAAMDGTIVVTLASVIASSFHASEKSSWLGSSYMLTVCAFSPIYGRLSDIIGRKGSMLLAMFFFTIGTAACAVAPSMDALLVARAVAGIGGGGILLSGSIILTDLVSIRQRGAYQGITSIIFGTGAGLGGPIGGLLNDRFNWRFCFYLQVPLLLLAGACIMTFIKIPAPSSEQTLRQKLTRIDYLGSFLLITGASSMLLSLSFLSADNLPFSNPKVWALLLLSIVLITIFVFAEGYLVKEPILPLKLLKERSPIFVGAFYFLSSVSYYAFIFNFAIYFQAVKLQSSREAGLHLLPLSVFTSAGSFLSGLYISATGKYYRMNIFCAALGCVGIGFVCFWNQGTSEISEYLGAVPSGFGIAANFTFLLIALLSRTPKEDQAVATGMIYLFRSLGQIIGVSTSGALLQSLLTTQLKDRLGGSDSEYIPLIRHDAGIIGSLPHHVKEAAVESYAYSLRRVFWSAFLLNILCVGMCVGVGSGGELEKSKTKHKKNYDQNGETA